MSTTTNPTTSASPATEHASQLTYTFDDRHWRVRGLEKQLSCERLKVNLLVARRELVHIDTLDLYAARLRRDVSQGGGRRTVRGRSHARSRTWDACCWIWNCGRTPSSASVVARGASRSARC